MLLCRSGVRSIAAAAATELGLTAYNILEGFEGRPGRQRPARQKGGWRFRGLPWRQDARCAPSGLAWRRLCRLGTLAWAGGENVK